MSALSETAALSSSAMVSITECATVTCASESAEIDTIHLNPRKGPRREGEPRTWNIIKWMRRQLTIKPKPSKGLTPKGKLRFKEHEDKSGDLEIFPREFSGEVTVHTPLIRSVSDEMVEGNNLSDQVAANMSHDGRLFIERASSVSNPSSSKAFLLDEIPSALNHSHSHQSFVVSENASSLSDICTFYTASSSSIRRSITRSVEIFGGGEMTHSSQLPSSKSQILVNEITARFLPEGPAGGGQLFVESEVSSTSKSAQFLHLPCTVHQKASDACELGQMGSMYLPEEAEAVRLVEDADDEFQSAAAASAFISGTTDVTGRLKKLGQLPTGYGGSSDVWKGELQDEKLDGRPVAIKVLRAVRIRSGNKSARLLLRLQREVRIWNQLKDDHIVPLIGFAFEGQFPCMVSPWYTNGNVMDYMARNPTADKANLVVNVVDGLVYLHAYDPPIVHGDLKAANVLIDDHGTARIADFGLSTILQEGRTGFTTSNTIQGSIRWMAPELFFYPFRTKASDVYSLTLLVLEIHSGGMVPFHHLTEYMFLGAITQYSSPDRSHYPGLELREQIWRALEDGWARDPEERPTAEKFRMSYIKALSSSQRTGPCSQSPDTGAPPLSPMWTNEVTHNHSETIFSVGTVGRPNRSFFWFGKFVKMFRMSIKDYLRGT